MEESNKISRHSGGLYQPLLHGDHHDSESDLTTYLTSELLRYQQSNRLRYKTILALGTLVILLIISNFVILTEFLRARELAQRLDPYMLYCEWYNSKS